MVKNPPASAGNMGSIPGLEDRTRSGATKLVHCCSHVFQEQTHSEGRCREWSAVYYTGGPKAESPLSQGPRPVFVKTLYALSVLAQTHLPKFLETSLDKVKERYNQS